MAVMLLQYTRTNASYRHKAHHKSTQCYMSVISQLKNQTQSLCLQRHQKYKINVLYYQSNFRKKIRLHSRVTSGRRNSSKLSKPPMPRLNLGPLRKSCSGCIRAQLLCFLRPLFSHLQLCWSRVFKNENTLSYLKKYYDIRKPPISA